MRLYAGPFGIGEIGLVCSAHPRYTTEPLSQDTFRTVSEELDFGHLWKTSKKGTLP